MESTSPTNSINKDMEMKVESRSMGEFKVDVNSSGPSSSSNPGPGSGSGTGSDSGSSSSSSSDSNPSCDIDRRSFIAGIQGYIEKNKELQMILKASFFAISVLSATPISRPFIISLFRTLSVFIFRIIGTAIGIGFGFGFAAFVHDELDRLSTSHEKSNADNNIGAVSTATKIKASLTGIKPSAAVHDENSYASLMASAGYAVPPGILRGHIQRHANETRNKIPHFHYTFEQDKRKRHSIYQFTPTSLTPTDKDHVSKGQLTFQRMWPNLPRDIQREMGILVDYVLRDYVACWYASVDDGIAYEDEEERRKRITAETEILGSARENAIANPDANSQKVTNSLQPNPRNEEMKQPNMKSNNPTMVLSTTPVRTIPFIEILYTSLVSVLGNLGTYASENVNILEIVLIKFLKIIKINIKVYRELRRVALQKQRRKIKLEEEKAHKEYIRKIMSGKKHVQNLASLTVPNKQIKALGRQISAVGKQGSVDTTNIERNEMVTPGMMTSLKHKKKEKSTKNVPNIPESSISATMQAPTSDQANESTDTSQIPQRIQNQQKTETSRASRVTNQQEQKYVKTESVSEISIVREYLLAGKLHRAITFGLDVPSLLFADPHGKECPPTDVDSVPKTGSSGSVADAGKMSDDDSSKADTASSFSQKENKKMDEDEVLKHRLFSNKQRILHECELDYNRLIAFRLCRILIPRNDFGSPIIRGMSVEMMASCILTPVMACFSPDYINGWIISGLEGSEKEDSSNVSNSEKDSVNFGTSIIEPPSDDNTRFQSTESAGRKKRLGSSDSADYDNGSVIDELEEDVDAVEDDGDNVEDDVDSSILDTGDLIEEDSLADEDSGLEDSSAGDPEMSYEDDTKQGARSLSDAEISSFNPNDTVADSNNVITSSPVDSSSQVDASDQILPLLAMSLIQLQSHIDFEDARLARKNNEEIGVQWDDKGCCDTVLNLVLVIEAALLHGMLPERRRKKALESIPGNNDSIHSNSECSDVDMENDATKEKSTEDYFDLEPKSLTVLLMEMTSDLEAFEKKAEDDQPEKSFVYEVVEDKDILLLPKPNANEISTLRTLIAAWLHTGLVFRSMSALINSKSKALIPFYHRDAFIRDDANAIGFVRQLRALDEVDILVDTMAVLTSPSLDFTKGPLIEKKDSDKDGEKEKKDSETPRFFPHTSPTEQNKAALDLQSSALASISPDPASVQMLRGWKNKAEDSKSALSIKGRKRFLQNNTDQHRISALGGSIMANFENNKKRFNRLVRVGNGSDIAGSSQISPSSIRVFPRNRNASFNDNQARSIIENPYAGDQKGTHQLQASMSQQQTGLATPSFLDFHRNEAFSASLRTERELRLKSFDSFNQELQVTNKTNVELICRSRVDAQGHVQFHRELHNLAKCFFSSTIILQINSPNDASNNNPSLTMETLSPRRKIEVPDEDSSFLLRAQARPLNFIGVHRDQRNHDLSYKCFASFFEEPILHPSSKQYRGGRIQKKCYLRYYPSNRTASIALMNEKRKLDTRDIKNQSTIVPSTVASFIPKDFLKERHLCHKSFSKGSERSGGTLSGSILASTIMEATDFNSSPRTGKAGDFVYRMSLFELPTVQLTGKKFFVQDSSAMGPHRADASSLEMSDAALTFALLMQGDGEEIKSETMDQQTIGEHDLPDDSQVTNSDQKNLTNSKVEIHHVCGPVVLMKASANTPGNSMAVTSKINGEKNNFELRPFRTSFIRAALTVMSSRQEAQLQCLLSCVRSGSARNATKARTDTLLQPALRLLDFATSKKREKQSVLLRDLKLGINHIDREQLRRNGLLNPRYPTLLRRLKTTVECAVQIKSNQNIDILAPNIILYKVRCVAVTEYVNVHNDGNGYGNTADGNTKPEYGDLFREEWVVMRSFRDFSVLHKHLKTQVAASESSAGAGAKIVGAATGLATAAFTIGNGSSNSNRQRKTLIPSLGQATKAGALGATKKSIEKRRVILTGYLNYLLSPRNLLNKCPELLRFLGAYDPLPAEDVLPDFTDTLGRSEISKVLLKQESPSNHSEVTVVATIPQGIETSNQREITSIRVKSSEKSPRRGNRKNGRRLKEKHLLTPEKIAQIKSARARVERIKLGHVRNTAFEIIRYQFDLDNASFFRSRMISAMKTMSFAVTSAHEFNKTLLDFHLKNFNGKELSEHVKYMRELIWPDGIMFESSPELSEDERQAAESKAKTVLHQAFPDQLKKILGQEIASDGLNILHEMLQNRVILKSMAYMMMDTFLLELFPEMNDVLTGTQVLNGHY